MLTAKRPLTLEWGLGMEYGSRSVRGAMMVYYADKVSIILSRLMPIFADSGALNPDDGVVD